MQNCRFGKPGEIGLPAMTGVKCQYLSKLLGYTGLPVVPETVLKRANPLTRFSPTQIIEVDKDGHVRNDQATNQ